jgi:hypothetical protein
MPRPVSQARKNATRIIMNKDLQTPFDIAIVVATVVRPTLAQAIRSVYAQRFGGRIQVLIGIDQWQGERAMLDALVAECPSHVAVTQLELGYSTSQRHGGLYPSHFGGALKTLLSYAANSRHVAYLDDDNWYAPDHVATMLDAVQGKAWAFALRNFVERRSGEFLCPDTWESLGPHRGVYAKAQGGFVDTNCYVIDTQQCSDVFPEWAMTRFAGGTGGDRQVLQRLLERPFGSNGAYTVNYRQGFKGLHPYLLWHFQKAGVDLTRYLPPQFIPGAQAAQEFANFERGQGQTPKAPSPAPGPAQP